MSETKSRPQSMEPQVYPGLNRPIGANARAIEELADLLALIAAGMQEISGGQDHTIHLLERVKERAMAIAAEVRKEVPWARDPGPKERG